MAKIKNILHPVSAHDFFSEKQKKIKLFHAKINKNTRVKGLSGSYDDTISSKNRMPMEAITHKTIFQGEIQLAKCLLSFSKME